jgi:hypothetical protein
MRINALFALVVLLAAAIGCEGCPPTDDDDTVEGDPEILEPEPVGAPTAMVDGRISCVGDNEPPSPSASSLELTGWVREWADPEADEVPSAFQVQAFDPNGNSVGVAFTNPSPGQDGRVAVTVPVTDEGFVGYVEITHDDFVTVRFHNSRPITNTDFAGWAWAVTEADVEQIALDAGVTLEPGTGILVGAVHDCDSFGMSNVVLVVDDSTDGVYWVEGWDPVDSRTFSAPSGRFALPNLEPGPVVVKSFGRLEQGGPLTLLSRVDAVIEADVITEVALEPRAGVER